MLDLAGARRVLTHEADRALAARGQRGTERAAQEPARARDADHKGRLGRVAGHGARSYAFFSRPPESAFRMSIGTGKIVVLLFSVAISASVCR